MKKNITITDIAKEAGVSIATVSRVLTGNARVAEDKKNKIQALIKKYDFHPNVLARGLLNTQTGLIGILTADIRNPFYSTMFVSCEQAANAHGYNLLLCNSFSDRVKEFELLDNLYRQHVDAIIMIGGAVDELITDMEYAEKVNLISEKIPFIITGRLDGTQCTRININTKKSMTLIMNYLAKNPNLKKIAFIGGSKKVKASVELRAGFRQLLKKNKLEYIQDFDIINDSYDEVGGYNAMNSILSNKTIPDAVIAINDFTAVGVMRSIKENHLSIPEDISLVSIDDTYLSTIVEPKLTSISYNYRQFGETIIGTAINLIQGRDVEQETFIEPKLIIRNSCMIN